jgi:hypothetical protein
VEGEETYILGNPPYLGFKMQDSEQKKDIANVFKGKKGFKKLDYISCWMLKGAQYIKGVKGVYSFVSTNSICQGEHASLLWPHIFNLGEEILFAHTTFKWSNNAKHKAAVFCVIVGVQNEQINKKTLFEQDEISMVDTINPYLVPTACGIVPKRSTPLSEFPKMQLGNMPKDDGNLILSEKEKVDFIQSYPSLSSVVKELVGAREYLNGYRRYCLWITKENETVALSNSDITNRVGKVKNFRLSSTDKAANQMAATPHLFREQHTSLKYTIIIPTVSSERRNYLPIGYLTPDKVVVAPNNALYDPPQHLFSVLESSMHMTWLRTFGGRLKSDYRYSSVLVYNTFPFPPITPSQEQTLTETALGILAARELHPGSTLAELYDPNKMPENLREAHRTNDLAVEACYRTEPFTSDEERLAYLFKLYEEMIAAEEEKDTLFAIQKKAKKTRKKKK